MDVNITSWALDSYMDLKSQNIFSDQEYKEILRPNVELLKAGLPLEYEKFKQDKFWGPVTDMSGLAVKGAYKMKWHNIGPGRVQLRLLIGIVHDAAWLCEAFVKSSDKIDKRFAAKMKIRMKDLNEGNVILRGRI